MLLSNGEIRGENLQNGTWPGGKHASQKAQFSIVGAGFIGAFHTSPTNAATFVSKGLVGYTRHPCPNRAHSGSHAETRRVLRACGDDVFGSGIIDTIDPFQADQPISVALAEGHRDTVPP